MKLLDSFFQDQGINCKELLLKEKTSYDETMNYHKQQVALIEKQRQKWRKDLAQHYFGRDFCDW